MGPRRSSCWPVVRCWNGASMRCASCRRSSASSSRCLPAAARVTDTVKRAPGEDLRVVETLDRSALWAVQTPQVFRHDALSRALAQPDDVLAAATDDAGLVEQAGGRVHVVESPADNLKVT